MSAFPYIDRKLYLEMWCGEDDASLRKTLAAAMNPNEEKMRLLVKLFDEADIVGLQPLSEVITEQDWDDIVSEWICG